MKKLFLAVLMAFCFTVAAVSVLGARQAVALVTRETYQQIMAEKEKKAKSKKTDQQTPAQGGQQASPAPAQTPNPTPPKSAKPKSD